MVIFSEFTWFPSTTRAEEAQRVVDQHNAGRHQPDHIRGRYNGGGVEAGCRIVDDGAIAELTAFLQPYRDVMSGDVHAIRRARTMSRRRAAPGRKPSQRRGRRG